MSLPDLNKISEWVDHSRNDSDALVNIGHALVALAEQLQVSNKIAAAQVLATLKNGYDERDAKLLLDEVREEYGV